MKKKPRKLNVLESGQLLLGRDESLKWNKSFAITEDQIEELITARNHLALIYNRIESIIQEIQGVSK
jgi:hypothetical protein